VRLLGPIGTQSGAIRMPWTSFVYQNGFRRLLCTDKETAMGNCSRPEHHWRGFPDAVAASW
ncbi:MAG: hypothetical protein ABWY81_01570, partial [Jiangellaceae bacterium]